MRFLPVESSRGFPLSDELLFYHYKPESKKVTYFLRNEQVGVGSTSENYE